MANTYIDEHLIDHLIYENEIEEYYEMIHEPNELQHHLRIIYENVARGVTTNILCKLGSYEELVQYAPRSLALISNFMRIYQGEKFDIWTDKCNVQFVLKKSSKHIQDGVNCYHPSARDIHQADSSFLTDYYFMICFMVALLVGNRPIIEKVKEMSPNTIVDFTDTLQDNTSFMFSEIASLKRFNLHDRKDYLRYLKKVLFEEIGYQPRMLVSLLDQEQMSQMYRLGYTFDLSEEGVFKDTESDSSYQYKDFLEWIFKNPEFDIFNDNIRDVISEGYGIDIIEPLEMFENERKLYGEDPAFRLEVLKAQSRLLEIQEEIARLQIENKMYYLIHSKGVNEFNEAILHEIVKKTNIAIEKLRREQAKLREFVAFLLPVPIEDEEDKKNKE